MKDVSKYMPWVRIGLRLVAGFTGGVSYASDNDAVLVGSFIVAAIVEVYYTIAKKRGWAT